MTNGTKRDAMKALEEALAAVHEDAKRSSSPSHARRIRNGLAAHAAALEAVRVSTDPVRMPLTTFDPADPNVVGRMVSIALIAQPLVPLGEITPSYGSGVYALYYCGNHPLYREISGSETPIYVGKADPANEDAGNPRDQGAKLTARLMEHANTIATVERYSQSLPAHLSAIQLSDFQCRKLVCATNAQLVAEKHLIQMFWPIWNQETKACWGMSKHGDSAGTRANKRSPWDVIHPGRSWALDARLVDAISPGEIEARINATLARVPPRRDHASLLEEMLVAFRQENTVDPDLANPPVGNSANGPTDDEAGGADDA